MDQKEKCCVNCAWSEYIYKGCQHPERDVENHCLGNYSDQGDSFRYDHWSETRDVCTCPTIKGPRMYDNPDFEMCDHCKAWHERYFPAFPGDPAWHLNSGAIDRNGWGINPAAIKTRDHERVTDLQLEAAHRAVNEACAALELLEHTMMGER